MLAEMISAILGYIKGGQFEKAEKAIENVYQTLLKEDISFFQKKPIEELTEELINEHHYTHGHLEILAELFLSEAELNFVRNKSEHCLDLYQKSLKLYEFLTSTMKVYSIKHSERLELIKQRISGLEAKK